MEREINLSQLQAMKEAFDVSDAFIVLSAGSCRLLGANTKTFADR